MRLQFGNLAETVYEKWKTKGDAQYGALKDTIIAIVNDPSSNKGEPFLIDTAHLICRTFGNGLYFLYSIDGDTIKIEAISSPIDTSISQMDADHHQAAIELMKRFMDNNRPKLGIFWYDYADNVLFGVEKGDAELFQAQGRLSTFPKLHKTYWQKMHHRAIALGDTDSIFYNEHDYTQIPRGRVFLENGEYYVTVGDWIDGYINGEKCVDAQKLRLLILDEFNLPESFKFKKDIHWNIGHGWSEEQF